MDSLTNFKFRGIIERIYDITCTVNSEIKNLFNNCKLAS